MKTNKLTNFLIIAAGAVIIFGVGFKAGEYKNSKSYLPANSINNARNFDFSLLYETMAQVENKFIDKKKIDYQKLYYGAIKGLVSSLEDPYTFFLTPEENEQSKQDLEGKFEGIGAQLGLKDGRVIVVAPLKNSPAEKSGVRAGDFINKVDGQSTKNWTLPTAVSKIRGEKGTKVTLTLERSEKEFELTITRDQIIVASVEFSVKNNSVAYLRLNQFGENTNAEWDKAVGQIAALLQSKKINGMVLDVRDNPGGYLESSVYLASEFLPRGSLVVKQESTVTPSKDYLVERDGKLINIPLTVLINKGSASASEILAGSLRDHKKATLIGEKTFGKGSVQEAIDLSTGAGLHVTVAKWILPNGDWINSTGIEPNIVIVNEPDEANTLTDETDAQLKRALDEILK